MPLLLAACLALPAGSFAQGHSHEAERPRPSRPDSRLPTATLSSLLTQSDEAVRAIERAVAADDPREIVEWADAYQVILQAAQRYLDETQPGRLAKELPRLDRALTRQRDTLGGLGERSQGGLRVRDPLAAALDASERALEAVSAAREELEHQEERRPIERSRGCGR